MPAVLFGQTASTTINEKAHDIIKKMIPFEKPYHIVLDQLIKVADQLLSICDNYKIEQAQFEKYYCSPEIK